MSSPAVVGSSPSASPRPDSPPLQQQQPQQQPLAAPSATTPLSATTTVAAGAAATPPGDQPFGAEDPEQDGLVQPPGQLTLQPKAPLPQECGPMDDSGQAAGGSQPGSPMCDVKLSGLNDSLDFGVNMMLARVFFDVLRNPAAKQLMHSRFQRKLDLMKVPDYISQLQVCYHTSYTAPWNPDPPTPGS